MLNADAFRLGHMLAQGNDPLAIAKQLGVSPDDLAAIGYVLPVILPGYEPLLVDMAAKHRTKIAAEALRRGVDLPDLASRTLQAVARDNLFRPLIDG